MDQEYQTWEPLFEIADMIPGISAKQLSSWESKRESNSFPEPKHTLGRHKFYDPKEVEMWVTLWKKATKNMGRGDKLNGKR